jgi:hypothetical protein
MSARKARIRTVALLSTAAVAAAGCRTVSAPAARPAPPGQPAAAGRVIRADRTDRFVIVHCGWYPDAGSVWSVERDRRPVGVVRFTGERRGGYAAAEIVSGEPAAGDRVTAPKMDTVQERESNI